LIDAVELAAYGGTATEPVPHTEAELATVLRLLARLDRAPVTTVAVGHSRDAASLAAAQAFIAAWDRRGEISTVVSWPESAASWLRPATRLTTPGPDAWVFAAAPLGLAQLTRRLRHNTEWDPRRTVGFSSLADPRLPAVAGSDTLHGMIGATATGDVWAIHHEWITTAAGGEPGSGAS
jgi:hypothetical protein